MKVKWSCNHLSDVAPALHFCEKKLACSRLFRMYVQKLGEEFEFVIMLLYCIADAKQTCFLIFNILHVSPWEDDLLWSMKASHIAVQ